MAYGDFAMGGFNMAQAMAGQQGGHLAGMAGQVMNAIQQENASRVAQMREQGRMQHEMNKLDMATSRDATIMRLEAIIARLQEELEKKNEPSMWSQKPWGKRISNVTRIG